MPAPSRPAHPSRPSQPPSIRLIAPHFGQLPAYLSLVLRSMAANPDVHWLLFTDSADPLLEQAPPNVEVRICEFEHLVKRIRAHFEFDICLDQPYKLCDYRPAFGEIFADELAGYDFWGHCDLDVIFGRIREFLPPEAYAADKVLFQGNFALYRNTAEAARWYRHEVGRVSYRQAMTRPEAAHFDEWAGIFYVVEDLGVPYWQDDVIFDLAFARYRTRAEFPSGKDPRRYAWENGEVCEYRVEHGRVLRRTALLAHVQKRVMRAPSPAVATASRYWIDANGFSVQQRVARTDVRRARIPLGREIVGLYVRRVQRSFRRRTARRALGAG